VVRNDILQASSYLKDAFVIGGRRPLVHPWKINGRTLSTKLFSQPEGAIADAQDHCDCNEEMRSPPILLLLPPPPPRCFSCGCWLLHPLLLLHQREVPPTNAVVLRLKPWCFARKPRTRGWRRAINIFKSCWGPSSSVLPSGLISIVPQLPHLHWGTSYKEGQRWRERITV
jgi:hypothetical protein